MALYGSKHVAAAFRDELVLLLTQQEANNNCKIFTFKPSGQIYGKLVFQIFWGFSYNWAVT
jgi:hypothetical protein